VFPKDIQRKATVVQGQTPYGQALSHLILQRINSADKIERTGVIQEGNIDLSSRKPVQTNGGYATVRSMSFSDSPGIEILIPTVVNGKIVSDADAIKNYYQTGQHLGKFTSPEAANKEAERIHNAEAVRIQRLGFN
jgi:hypothetical protein